MGLIYTFIKTLMLEQPKQLFGQRLLHSPIVLFLILYISSTIIDSADHVKFSKACLDKNKEPLTLQTENILIAVKSCYGLEEGSLVQ